MIFSRLYDVHDGYGTALDRAETALTKCFSWRHRALIFFGMLKEYLDQRADVDDGRPNEAMCLLTEMHELVAEARK